MRVIRAVRAFAPGHVTGIFSPDSVGRDPRARGSRGAGVVLDLGVVASALWQPGRARRVRILGGGAAEFPISAEVAQRLVGDRTGFMTVRLHHDLPIGHGFGMSAAGATATALAVSGALGRTRSKAHEVAHLGDLFGGGGLGGVAAILGGGIEFRRSPGIPPFGTVTRLPWAPSVFVGVAGPPVPSPSRLGDPRFLRRVAESASGLGALLARPDAARFFRASEGFTDRMAVASPRLFRLMRDLRTDGARTFQAMFGESFLTAPRTPASRERVIRRLRAARIPSVETRVALRGARRIAPPPAPRAGRTQPF